MPSAVVTTVAWLALALAAAALVAVVLVVRELRALGRAHTDRKWEIQGLRAELTALRRHAAAELSEAHPSGARAAIDAVVDTGAGSAPGLAPDDAPVVDAARSPRPSPSSPTAWRRRRARTAARAPRRRPGG